MDASSKAERVLLYLMLACNDLIPRIVSEIGLEGFHNQKFFKIAEKVIELYGRNSEVKAEDVLHMLDDGELNKILMDIVTTEEFQHITDYEEWFTDCMQFFRRRNNKKEIHQVKRKMLESIKNGKNEEDIAALLDEFHKKNKSGHILKGKVKV